MGLSGCSIYPNAGPLAGKEVAEINNSIVDRKTTTSDLVSIFGDKKSSTTTPEGKNVLNWYKTWSSGFTQDCTVLSVLVDNNVVVKHAVLRYKTRTDFSFVKSLTDTELNAFITPGKTTRQEIEEKYGTPNDNSFDDNGNQIMLYIYADASNSKYGWIPNVGGFIEGLAGSVNTQVSTLQIPLNSHNVATSYLLKKTHYRQGVGLLNSSAPTEVK